MNVAVPFAPVRIVSPLKIVASAGAGELFTYTSPTLVNEPSGWCSCERVRACAPAAITKMAAAPVVSNRAKKFFWVFRFTLSGRIKLEVAKLEATASLSTLPSRWACSCGLRSPARSAHHPPLLMYHHRPTLSIKFQPYRVRFLPLPSRLSGLEWSPP